MSSPSPRIFSRRGFTLAALAGVGMTAAACNGNGIGTQGASVIDARVDATLKEMYRLYPNTQPLAEQASGVLVMPLMTEAGLWLGGAYGRGALRVNDITVDYYSATKASAGLQIGAQQYAHVLFFMTEQALRDFRSSAGWSVGADMEYVVADTAGSLGTDSNRLTKPILAAVFGQAGLRIGATLDGTKYTRIIP
ncbi:lipid-binding SYLF domain-containing protein [Pontibaca methylaminivorans]|uniref:Las17-binding protein actin regulator n=1 Tax=Pontibaca methylaminivorans TaxID=515897 RepID=A0A1R3W8M5_9RHOB|nr:YSC84-related protein [Pontibaca methylaminivorans]SIT74102.1 Las17-binding protein actin regulator [Pontibaca methylaminivorans]